MRFDIIIISGRRKETNTSIDLDLDATTTKEKLTQILVVPSGTRGRERGTDIGKIFERKPLILFTVVYFAYLFAVLFLFVVTSCGQSKKL